MASENVNMTEPEGMEKMMPETEFSKSKSCTRQPLCARTSYSCNKILLFIYTVLFLFAGIIMMAVGVLVETHRQKMESLNNQLLLPVALLILVGMVITLNSICGLVGTLAEHVTMLKVFLVVTIVAFLMQVAIGIIAFVYREDVPEILEDHLRFVITGYGDNTRITRAMDYFQSSYKCCGLGSYMDYSKHNKNYGCDSDKAQACGVPSSCCITESGRVQPACGYGIVGNLSVSDKVYIVGCLNTFVHWLAEHLDLTGAMALGFAIPQIVGILLVYFFIRRVSDYQKGYRVGQYFG